MRGYAAAVIGGACAGSEIASQLRSLGFEVVVFEQNALPYGKIEDGLPRWHDKLQTKEMLNIDKKLLQEGISYVPHAKLGRDIQLKELQDEWKFHLIVLATGAWRDRPMNLPGLEEVKDDSFVYQNDLVQWFNHKHEPHFNGKSYEIPANPVIVGGGLASIDVGKICQFERVIQALKRRGELVDPVELEHYGVEKVCESRGVVFSELGIAPARLFYRKRVKDMPLMPLGEEATPEKLLKAESVREKIVANVRRKYGFEVVDQRAPVAVEVVDGGLKAVHFAKMEYREGRWTQSDEIERVETEMLISSIGSIPQPIPGISMAGELYKTNDPLIGELSEYSGVFCIGNAITGRGNIKESTDSARCLGEMLGKVLEGSEFDFAEYGNREEMARRCAERLAEWARQRGPADESLVKSINEKVAIAWKTRSYRDYQSWKDEVFAKR